MWRRCCEIISSQSSAAMAAQFIKPAHQQSFAMAACCSALKAEALAWKMVIRGM
jgi:hypothetical protein